MNIALTPDILASLLSCKANQNNFYKLWKAIPSWDKENMANSKDTPKIILYHLANEDNFAIAQSLAKNEQMIPEILKFLSTNSDYFTRFLVAQNTATTPDILAALSTNRDEYVLRAVARNPKTPPSILTELFNTGSNSIRDIIIKNTSWANYES
jgi:hypothetical protein